MNFRDKESYKKAQLKRDKLWEQTRLLDDIGTLGLCGGLFCQTFTQSSKTKKIIGNSFLVVGILATLAGMTKRTILAHKIKE